MAKSALFEASVLNLILNGVGITGIADNTATAPLADLYVRLHTADPGPGGNQSTSEISYTGYAAVAVARSSGAPAWTITGSNPAVAKPNATIVFPGSTGGTGGTVTNFSIGTAATGASEILYSGTVTPNLVVANGTTPELTTSTSISET